MLREPSHILLLQQTVDVWLNTIEVTGVLLLQVNDEVNIVPDEVVLLSVEVKAILRISIQLHNASFNELIDITYSVAIETA